MVPSASLRFRQPRFHWSSSVPEPTAEESPTLAHPAATAASLPVGHGPVDAVHPVAAPQTTTNGVPDNGPTSCTAGVPTETTQEGVSSADQPKFCVLNHDELPTEHTCGSHAGCRSARKCVVELQGEMLCGPCKNFKMRGMQRPSSVTTLSTVSVVGAVVAGPISFCLSIIGVGMLAQGAGAGAVFFGVIGLLLPLGVLVLSFWALKEIESKPRTGGRMLALTGAASGLIGTLWCVTVTLIMIVKLIQQQQ